MFSISEEHERAIKIARHHARLDATLNALNKTLWWPPPIDELVAAAKKTPTYQRLDHERLRIAFCNSYVQNYVREWEQRRFMYEKQEK